MKANILIVEDQFIEAKGLKLILNNAGYRTCSIARSVASAISIMEKEKPDLVLLDIFLTGEETGIDLGCLLHEKNVPFVYLSANSNRQVLELAKTTQPFGFMVKPFRAKDVLITVDVALYLHQFRQPMKEELSSKPMQAPTGMPAQTTGLIGRSPGFLELVDQIGLVAPSDISVLLLGESGTGKEVIAHAIHRSSPRRYRPFVAVNCGALPANLIESELFGHEKGAFTDAEKKLGKFELADNGTIFLDEIGDMPIELQVKLLRVLQEKEIEPIGGRSRKVNVRIVAATNRDLEEAVADGRFRIDLFYRLNVFTLQLPPLRERKEDIPLLAAHFIEKYAAQTGKPVKGATEKAMQALQEYRWPGNIRELENTVHKNVILAKGPVIESFVIKPSALEKPSERASAGRFKTIAENERDHIIAVLESCNWKVYGPGGAAEVLGINVNTLNSRIKKLDIKKQISIRP
jgi:DNA-binding NtrC family response regulator